MIIKRYDGILSFVVIKSQFEKLSAELCYIIQ